MSNDFWRADSNPMWDIIIVGVVLIGVVGWIINQFFPSNYFDNDGNGIKETLRVKEGRKTVGFRIDRNEDGYTDVEDYVDEEDEKIVSLREIDLNFDRKIDLIVHYNKLGIPYKIESPNNYYDLYASPSGILIKDYIFEPKYIADDIKSGGIQSQREYIEEYKYVNGMLVYSEDHDIQTGGLMSKTTYDGEIGDILRLEMLLGDKWEVIIPK